MRVWRQGGVAAERACFQAPRASARWQQRSRAAWAAQQVANGSPVKFFSAAATAAEDKKEPESKGLLDKLADPFVNSKLFGPHTGQSPEGFTNRWLFVPPAMAAHLCIGAPWAWSALSGTLTREHGFVCSAASDWSLGDATYPMQLAFLMQGVGAALVGGWQLKVGMRSSMAVAGGMFGGGMMLGGAGIAMHNLTITCLGAGLLAGSGIGTMYTPPLGALIQWFPDKKGLASGLVICGFGGAGLVFTQLVNMGTDHFQKLPTFAGLPGSLETTIESGRMLATVDGQQTEVVLATQADLAKLTTDLAEGYYVVGSGDTGAAATLAVLGTGYLATMLASSFLMRRPHPTYVPAGYTPPEPAAAGATDKENGYIIPAGQNVPLGAVMKTPQFWLMSGTFFSLATGGMALASVAKPLMADVFTGALPGVVTAGFGSLYLQMMMGSNLGGRLGWAAISDQIGRRNTFLIFTAASVPCYAMLPTLTSTVIDTGSAVPLYGFIGASLFATTMMGGTYALMPAYEADLFGAKYVGPIHGRFLLFGAGASGMVGPEVVKKLRGDSEAAEMEKLLGQVDPAKFNDLFGVGMDKAEELVQAKTLTIAKLMTIAPEGLPDPSPFIYDSTMYAMAGLMSGAFVAHYAVGAVNPKHYEVLTPPPAAAKKNE